jgi:arylsulfatase A-like enzyme
VRFTRRGGGRPLRFVLAALALIAGAAACTGPSGSHTSTAPDPVPGRPNIVFVLTDDLSTNLVPYMPHVRALMQSGTSFGNYFVVDSLCCPSRSSIFTGQYPHNTGVYTNEAPDGGYDAFNRFGNQPKSFAIGLQRAGYRTAMLGKYLNGYHPSNPVPPGWNEWDVAGNGYPEFDYRLNEDGTVHSYGHAAGDYLTDVLSTKAQQFIESAADGGHPFAVEVATFSPHAPYTPAVEDKGTFPNLRAPRGPTFGRTPTGALPWLATLPPLTPADEEVIDKSFRSRVESVQSVDRMIGALEQKLDDLGLLQHTYFVFSSDNGYHMGEYRMRVGKLTAFDTDIRVPLVVAGPGVPAGRTVSAFASNIDLAPTFLAMGGARPTGRPDGVSLLDLIHGRPVPADWQRAVLIEHHDPHVSSADPDAQQSLAGKPPGYEAIRTKDFLYVEYRDGGREYYDLRHDPDELHNIAGELTAARLRSLHAQLGPLTRCEGAARCRPAALLRPTA